MPRSFFLLLRFYLRVDGVLVRVNDTRLYHEADQAYMLREYTSRQSLASELKVSHQSGNAPARWVLVGVGEVMLRSSSPTVEWISM